MKRIKRIVSFALAAIMVFAMSAPAFAADNTSYTITITQNTDDNTSHTYEAYQIFVGDLAANTDVTTKEAQPYVLSNINWGSNVDGSTLLTELKKEKSFVEGGDNLFNGCTTAAQVAEVLSSENFESSNGSETTATDTFARIVEGCLTGSAGGTITGTGNVSITVTGAGYYLVKDESSSVKDGGAYTRFILQVVGNVTASVKSEVPSGDKQIITSLTGETENLADANNTSIGSHVSFKITSNVPNYVGYNYYYFIMNDTLSKGLTFDGADSVTVTIDGQTLTQGKVASEGVEGVVGGYYVYGPTQNSDGSYTFRIAFADIMTYEIGKDIVVTYSATVNNNAVVGTSGNKNTWTLQYSNNPDATYDGGKNESTTQPGLPANEKNEPLGETPEQITLTYLTKLDITKYADSVESGKKLSGAEFTLTGTSKQVVLENVEYYIESSEYAKMTNPPTRFDENVYYLLLNGSYTSTKPEGMAYEKIGVGTADTTKGYLYDEETNTYYIPENKSKYVGETIYKLVKGAATDYADVNTTYVKVKATEVSYVDAPVSIELTTDESGKISFTDLGEGTYTLTETVTPAGYNTLDPITIVISCETPTAVTTGNETCTWTMKIGDKTIDGQGGVFAYNVVNQSGSVLPSTGGIGTTIFYIVGAILVIGAGILLVAKKRMGER